MELSGQRRGRRRELAQERAHGVDAAAGHDLTEGRRLGRRGARLRRAGRPALGLRLQPGLDRRVAQQLGQRAQLLSVGLGWLSQHGSDGQQAGESYEDEQHLAHVDSPVTMLP